MITAIITYKNTPCNRKGRRVFSPVHHTHPVAILQWNEIREEFPIGHGKPIRCLVDI